MDVAATDSLTWVSLLRTLGRKGETPFREHSWPSIGRLPNNSAVGSEQGPVDRIASIRGQVQISPEVWDSGGP